MRMSKASSHFKSSIQASYSRESVKPHLNIDKRRSDVVINLEQSSAPRNHVCLPMTYALGNAVG